MHTNKQIAIIGFSGKMGQAIFHCLPWENMSLGIGIARDAENDFENPNLQTSHDYRKAFIGTAAVIDFSHHNLTSLVLQHAIDINYSGALFIGTTGYEFDKIYDLAQQFYDQGGMVALVRNTSMGIVYVKTALKAILNLKPNCQINIVEKHHITKQDRPSGTALGLQGLISDLGYDSYCESIREDSTVGVHQIKLNMENENITLTHEVKDRKLFAQGALEITKIMLQKNKPMFLHDNNIDSIIV